MRSATPYLRSFRIQTQPSFIPLVLDLLTHEGFRTRPEPFSPFCFALTHEPKALGSSLAAHFGLIYIQDRSSMLPPLALAPKTTEVILDMCASPGSKTSFLANLQDNKGCIVANEPNPTRLATLRANLDRVNAFSCVTIKTEAEKMPLANELFDAIALDPPCSGWGTVAKHPKVKTIWTDEKTTALQTLQRRLLARASELLKPGGRILYSTCTTNPRENEDQIKRALETLPLRLIPLPAFPGFVYDTDTLAGSLRIDQEASKAQGFFLALLTKDGSPTLDMCTDKNEPAYLTFDDLPPGTTLRQGNSIFFLPSASAHILGTPPKVPLRGGYLGEMKGERFVPHPRCRILAKTPPYEAIHLDSLQTLYDLLAGRSCQTSATHKEAILFWKELPLAFVAIKNGRLLCPR